MEAEAGPVGGNSAAAYMMETAVVIADSIRPIMDAGLHELVEVDHRLSDEVYWNTRRGIRPATCACTSCRAASTPSSQAT
jgi:hypothetical protein